MSKSANNDGRKLEKLAAFLEELKLPPNFTVETNKLVKSLSGEDEAELDIVISGPIGSAKFQWLIECRDRPSSGAAPAAWIEQLIGRRHRFQLNKVTAVSTQKFSKPAAKLAKQNGIDLRQVKALTKDEFENWLKIPSYKFSNQNSHLLNMHIIFPESCPQNLLNAAEAKVAMLSGREAFLTRVIDGTHIYPKDAFSGAVGIQNLFDDIMPNQQPKRIKFGVKSMNPDDCFGIETDIGLVRIEAIIFDGELSIEELDVPLEEVLGYQNIDQATPLSQTAIFKGQRIGDADWALALHRDLHTDEISIVMMPSKL